MLLTTRAAKDVFQNHLNYAIMLFVTGQEKIYTKSLRHLSFIQSKTKPIKQETKAIVCILGQCADGTATNVKK